MTNPRFAQPRGRVVTRTSLQNTKLPIDTYSKYMILGTNATDASTPK